MNGSKRYEGLSIKCAAIMAEDGEVHSVDRPGRHHDVITKMILDGYSRPIRGEQGFLLNTDQFVRRVPAKNIAREAGQLLPRAKTLRELYSEDVW